jgi:ribose 1,5-bisphosphokinase
MDADRIGPGRFVAVVGPSGSGKDSILRAAAASLAGKACVIFPRRVITRPPDLHEDHLPITRAEFRAAQSRGAFALDWEAHGLCYGIPVDIEDALRAGKMVAVNVSRSVIPALRARYACRTVAVITVSADRLAGRLSQRGRETPGEIEDRIARAPAARPVGDDVVAIDNDGPLEAAVARFLALLGGD